MIYSGQIGGKILHAHNYRDGREDEYGLFLGLVLRLVVPPLQLIWYGVLDSLIIYH
jgi:hypothetical protein